MRNNRLLILAVILIALGLMGVTTTTWFGSYREPRKMFPMPGVMLFPIRRFTRPKSGAQLWNGCEAICKRWVKW